MAISGDVTGAQIIPTGGMTEQNLADLLNGATGSASITAFGVTMLAWFNSLPTTLPATAGVLWNNGGTLAKS